MYCHSIRVNYIVILIMVTVTLTRKTLLSLRTNEHHTCVGCFRLSVPCVHYCPSPTEMTATTSNPIIENALLVFAVWCLMQMRYQTVGYVFPHTATLPRNASPIDMHFWRTNIFATSSHTIALYCLICIRYMFTSMSNSFSTQNIQKATTTRTCSQ